jgi:hypothetical protein
MEVTMKSKEKYTRRDELDYMIFGCLLDYTKTYSESLKIARALIRNGIRVVGV